MRNFANFLLILLLLGCTNSRSLSPLELSKYVLDSANGLIKESLEGDVKIQVVYRPKALIIEQQSRAANANELKQFITEIDSVDYFLLRLSKKGYPIEFFYSQNRQDYSTVINHLSGGIAEGIKIRIADKIFSPAFVSYSGSYGLSGETNILVAFKANLTKGDQDFEFLYVDDMFGYRQEFKFYAVDLKNIPSLN